ncbi:hypothetical protein [Burkholderia sp. LMG 21824]|uniref:hypothetical protein n=1 Tax=Burkholderia sp. LMG 21824 TaxID=3158172 RepID=UPI003C30628A
MDYRVSYEHSLNTDPNDFIVHVPSQLVEGVPGNNRRKICSSRFMPKARLSSAYLQ